MKEVTIYTDGACSGNPGPGGWGAVLMFQGKQKEISGGAKNTTNNIMEITAVIEALKLLKESCKVKIYSDSAYVVNAFNEHWIEGWIAKNWQNSKKEPVKNKELWQELISLKNKEKKLKVDANKLQDPDYIARYAREKYLYSKDGEFILKIPEE